MKDRIMLGVVVVVCFLIITTVDAGAGTWVWLLYGAGGQSTSTGIDEIAAKARAIPGVSEVNVREFQERQRVVDEIMAAGAEARIVVGGYSCGLNSATAIARMLWERGRKVATVVGIQQSKWCGGDALESNVSYGQSTYNADCPSTMGLGCKPIEGAPSFLGQIVNIDRPDSHGEADNDPEAQADVLKAIAATAWYGAELPAPALQCRWGYTQNRGFAVLCSWP